MDDSYYQLLKPLLHFGQVLGFPLPEQHGKEPNYRKISHKVFMIGYSLFMTIISLLLLLIKFQIFAKVPENTSLIESGLGILYHVPVFALYVHLFQSRKCFGAFLTEWRCLSWHIKPEKIQMSSVYTSILVLFGSAIVETILFDAAVCQKQIGPYKNATFLEKYVDNTVYETESLQSIRESWNPIFMGAFYILSKLITLSTDYSDALCITLVFGITARLQLMNKHLKHHLYIKENPKQILIFTDNGHNHHHKITDQKNPTKIYWPHIYRDFVKLRILSDQISKFASPLILVSLKINVFAAVAFLDDTINLSARSQQTHANGTHTGIYISLWHYVIRTVLVIHFASGVYRTSDETLAIIKNAPESVQSWPDTEPILAMLRRKPIGIVFFDTYFITRSLFISILNFVFTIEVMILQASSS
ncbi:unnamed protein product [Orchesella dallaii]|uniref:Gustatory receptor n=1 Tax=Orchesella dallaii TaxID=48710 RepID=A0ABP1R131_9HEXA